MCVPYTKRSTWYRWYGQRITKKKKKKKKKQYSSSGDHQCLHNISWQFIWLIQEVSQKTKCHAHDGLTGKIRISPKSSRFILRGPWMGLKYWLQFIQQLRCVTDNQKCHPHGGTSAVVMGSEKSVWFILWGPWMSIQNFSGSHLKAGKILQSGWKWWTDWPTFPTNQAVRTPKIIQKLLLRISCPFFLEVWMWMWTLKLRSWTDVSPANAARRLIK